MEYRYVGRSGLRVSVLSFGTMTLGGVGVLKGIGSNDLPGAQRQIDICLEAGVNLFDTANTYGSAEEIVGEVTAGRRQRMLLATKARFPTGTGPNDQGLSRNHLISSCEASLRKMKTDYIDLYQLHGWDGCTPLEETFEAMDHLVRTGKVRYIGVSNFSGWHVMKALAVTERNCLARPISHQIYYSLAAREAEYELVPIAVDQGVGILVWGPLSGGLLSGKYRRGHGAPANSRGDAPGWDEYVVRNREQVYDVVELLADIAATHDATPSQVALAWLIGRPGIASVIVGARTEQQLRANLGAADITLSVDERRRLDRASGSPLIYPYWQQARFNTGRFSPADLTLLSEAPVWPHS
jgi:aryl-alcohol dehydrogenase-like predicted oxidoreductase